MIFIAYLRKYAAYLGCCQGYNMILPFRLGTTRSKVEHSTISYCNVMIYCSICQMLSLKYFFKQEHIDPNQTAQTQMRCISSGSVLLNNIPFGILRTTCIYSKTCLKRYPLSPNAGRKYCRMLQESILQYF